MDMSLKDNLLKVNSSLIEEGVELTGTQSNSDVIGMPTSVDTRQFHKWWGKVRSFAHRMGKAAKPWEGTFLKNPQDPTLDFVEQALGVLEATKHEIENDHLSTVTQIIKAETLSDLMDQAKHLEENGYFLAAGVIGRAILEEHLRNLCVKYDCFPDKPRPTINDYNQSLYKSDFFNKVRMKHVEVLATIGNDAAHNKSSLSQDNVSQLLRDLPAFIDQTEM